MFQDMVEKLTPILKKKTTFMREPLEVGLKLATTLRFLATGNSYASLQYSFRVDASTICKFVPEVCKAIIQVYQKDVIRCPRTPAAWKAVAEGFSSRWNYHNCLGAVDGKHVAIKKPPKAGSFYYNYKGFHSIVLMAVVDSGYKFMYVDVGAEGGASDGGTWTATPLHKALEDGRAALPDPAPLPNDDRPIPYHFVADDVAHEAVFTQITGPQRDDIQLQVVPCETCCGECIWLLSQRFRCFTSTMLQHPRHVITFTLCSCVLHNLILNTYPLNVSSTDVDREDTNTHEIIPGGWRDGQLLEGLNRPPGQHNRTQAKDMRDYLSRYYVSEAGAVEWQDRMIAPKT